VYSNNIPEQSAGYAARLAKAMQNHPELFPLRDVSFLRVAHEKKCRHQQGRGCNCHPDMSINVGGSTYTVDHNGECHKES